MVSGVTSPSCSFILAQMVACMKDEVKDLTNEDEIAAFIERVIRKETGDGSGLIYGMGHAVYTLSDPRAKILRERARKFSVGTPFEEEFIALSLIEKLTPEVFEKIKGTKKKMCANVDLYSGFVYKMLGIPDDLFTPMFTVARVAGWSAHRLEELTSGKRIIRPAYKSVCLPGEYIPIAQRTCETCKGDKEYVPTEQRD